MILEWSISRHTDSTRLGLIVLLVSAWLTGEPRLCMAADPLTVTSDFEGASVQVLAIDDAARSIHFMPGGDPVRGWPCWWYFRLDGITPNEAITLRLRGSTATLEKQKLLSESWAMPVCATLSVDGETWQRTDKGQRQGEWMNYTLKPDAASMYVAWGPPYTPGRAVKYVRDLGKASPHATAEELCRSREGRPVPLLHVREGDRTRKPRFGIWVQARQHAWECGSSWVAQGFSEWLLGDSEEAAWLRQHAEIFIVPVMDVDNTATGNGGKNALPHDHNRDWSQGAAYAHNLIAGGIRSIPRARETPCFNPHSVGTRVREMQAGDDRTVGPGQDSRCPL